MKKLGLVFLLIGLGFLIGCGADDRDDIEYIDSRIFADEYDDAPFIARLKYQGKRIALKGRITSVYACLNEARMNEIGSSIFIEFRRGTLECLGNNPIRVGDYVIVEGRVNFDGYIIELLNTELIDW